MAYPTTPGSPNTPGARPSTVNLASILLYLAGALQLLGGILALAFYGATQRGYEKAYAGTSMAGQEGSAAVGQLAGAIIGIIFGIILLVLAFLVGKGNRVSRILTWVFGGIALCCGVSGLGLTAAGESLYEAGRTNNSDLPPYSKLQDALTSELPGWYTPLTVALGVIGILALLTAMVLLALPKSHPYFRKSTEPQWEPPVPPTS